MASTAGPALSDTHTNFAGEVMTIGSQMAGASFLELVGGMNAPRLVRANTFPIGVFFSLDNAASVTVTEAASVTAPTATSYTAAQVTQYVEIKQERNTQSYQQLSNSGLISGVAYTPPPQTVITPQTQRDAIMMQFAKDWEYDMLLGAGTAPANSSTNGKMRGIYTAVAGGSTEVDAASAQLEKSHVDALELAVLAGPNATARGRWVFLGGGYQIQRLTSIYKNEPQSANIGGITLDAIRLPILGQVGLVFNQIITSSVLMLVNLNFVMPVIQPVPGDAGGGGERTIFWETLAKTGAAIDEQLYGQVSVDYGRSTFHGAIKALATS